MRLNIPALEDLAAHGLHHRVMPPPTHNEPFTLVEGPAHVRRDLDYHEVFEMSMTFASRISAPPERGGQGGMVEARLRHDLVRHVYGGLLDHLRAARDTAREEQAFMTLQILNRTIEPLSALITEAEG